MKNMKKIGMTALAASLASTSAFAGAVTVSGGASIGLWWIYWYIPKLSIIMVNG